jgi:hypothetical protein
MQRLLCSKWAGVQGRIQVLITLLHVTYTLSRCHPNAGNQSLEHTATGLTISTLRTQPVDSLAGTLKSSLQLAEVEGERIRYLCIIACQSHHLHSRAGFCVQQHHAHALSTFGTDLHCVNLC